MVACTLAPRLLVGMHVVAHTVGVVIHVKHGHSTCVEACTYPLGAARTQYEQVHACTTRNGIIGEARRIEI